MSATVGDAEAAGPLRVRSTREPKVFEIYIQAVTGGANPYTPAGGTAKNESNAR